MHDAPAYQSVRNGKVFIIDEAELMDNNGQNSILKTLEEPPRDTWIILVTSRPNVCCPPSEVGATMFVRTVVR